MSDPIVQLGTALTISAGSFAISGYIVTEDGSVSWTKVKDIKEVMDINGATHTKLLKNPKQEFSGTIVPLDSVGNYTPLEIGSAVAITDPDGNSLNVMIEEWNPDLTSEESKISFKFVLEESMTYTP